MSAPRSASGGPSKMGPAKKQGSARSKKESPKKRREQQEKAERLLKIFCVRKMQRMYRVHKVRFAVRAIHELEDFVFEGQPTPGIEAYQMLFDGPNPETTGGAIGFELAMRLHGPPPDLFGKKTPSDAGSQLSRGTGRAKASEQGSVVSGSRQGSRQGSAPSSSRSQRSNASSENVPRLSQELLIFRLGEYGVENAAQIAHLIFWILDCEGELSPEDLEVVYRHHRIRRRNMVSRVVLHLILVLPGNSDWLAAAESEDGAQPLLPEGWAQVTRTGWLLRAAGAAWLPGLVLRGSPQCCAETADRMRLIADDGGLEQGADNTDANSTRASSAASRRSSKTSRRSSKAKRRRSKLGQQSDPECYTFPAAHVCEALDYPRPNRKNRLDCPATYDIHVEVGRILRRLEPAVIDVKEQPNEPMPVLLVAGASVLELLLSCLTSGRPREDCLTARLTGGDAVLLTSPFMCQLTGEGANECWRPNSELWEEAMRRDDWLVHQHFRGDGRGLPEEAGGFPPPPSPLFKRKPDARWVKSDIRSAWNTYAGPPLILGERDYNLLRQRAGLEHTPLQEHVCKALKPLTKLAPDTPPPEPEDEEEASLDQTRSREQVPSMAASMPGAPGRRGGLLGAADLKEGIAGLTGATPSGTPQTAASAATQRVDSRN
mmetsp:Transcript_139955/g.241800  ORF Transcript_139955/g.241800 Transcript_139955/m.241800 type:complete len:659 (-) Transcript_139955:74-2050(-)